jgi:hypothetical protein
MRLSFLVSCQLQGDPRGCLMKWLLSCHLLLDYFGAEFITYLLKDSLRNAERYSICRHDEEFEYQ